jgi:hypothetical protein
VARGIEISEKFYRELIRPVLVDRFPDLFELAAIGVLGNGSETVGLDDDISRDHCWAPRVNIFLPDELCEREGENLLYELRESLPDSFEAFQICYPKHSRAGVSVESFGYFFRCFAKMDAPPQTDLDWFRTTESDLFHLTDGKLFHDASGEFTRRREAFTYYPDDVWKKKIADWCLYFTGSASPYNVHRASRRGDFVTAQLFLGGALKRAMELCFLLNRTYAPYSKWLPRLLPKLPRLGQEVHAHLSRAAESNGWKDRVMSLVEVAHLYAIEIHQMGLSGEPDLPEFDPNFATLALYRSAHDIYKTLPPEILHAKFNEAEWWECLTREILCDSDDFFPEIVAASDSEARSTGTL